MSSSKVPNALKVLRIKERCSLSQRSFPSNFNHDTISDSDKWGGGRKGAREDEGDNNKITRSLGFIMCMSLWHCWSIMFVMGEELLRENWGKEHSHGASRRKNKYILMQFNFTSDASLLG